MAILIACILINAFLGVVFKMFDKYKIDNLQAITVNYFTCVLTAIFTFGEFEYLSALPSFTWFPYAVGLGFFFVSVFTITAMAVQQNGIMIASIFQKMSLIAPVLVAILWYGESAHFTKIAGIIAAIAAIFMLSNDGKNKLNLFSKESSLFLPFMVFLSSCLIDLSLYLIDRNKIAPNADVKFLSSLFLFAGIGGLVQVAYKLINKKTNFQWKNVLGGIILGIPNFFSIYLILKLLAEGWDGSTVFPFNNVGVLLTSAILGILVFKEELNKYKLFGLALAITAIVLLAL